MNKLSVLLIVVALTTGFARAADAPVTAGDDPAQRLTAMSLREEVAAGDPRVAQTRAQIARVVKLSGEEPMAVATACLRYTRHLFDAIHERATPLELLDALASFGKAGKPINDTLLDYVAARKAAASKGHTEAMAALSKKP